MPKWSVWASTAVFLFAATALAAPDPGAGGSPIEVTFAPRIDAKIRATYGAAEVEVIRDAVTSALSESLRKAGASPEVRVAVEVTDVAPTHPTRQQSLDSPSIDPLRSVSLGGAALTGTVRGPDGRVVTTLAFNRFAPDLSTVSSSIDAWADARISIRMFASKLARKVAAGH